MTRILLLLLPLIAGVSAHFFPPPHPPHPTFAPPNCNATLPQVDTEYGTIEGFCIAQTPIPVNAFLSVPFAKPPLGILRFEKPARPDNWDGVLSTKVQPPRCAQTGTAQPVSEDCLYLNIFSPADHSSHPGNTVRKYPVIVGFYGGAFATGGARVMGDVYVAQTLVAKGSIVVFPQYRVGGLGWFSTGDSWMPGNYGLWDAKLALEWVRDNIEAFGGDPDRVTVFGGSAGGTLIDCLTLSPLTYNLFANVYGFSGDSGGLEHSLMVQNTIDTATALNLTFSNSSDLKNALQQVPAISIGGGWLTVTTESELFLIAKFSPIYDGEFFPQPFKILRTLAPPKPRIVGSSICDGAAFTGAITITNSSITDLMQFVVPDGFPNRTAYQQWFLDSYYATAEANEPDAVVKAAFQTAFGEHIGIANMIGVYDKLLEIHGPAQKMYLYILEYFNPLSVGASYPYIGEAYHASEQAYIQGTGGWAYNANDTAVSDFFTSFLVNFAATGDPNGVGLPTQLPVTWEPMTQHYNSRHLNINLQSTMTDGPYFGGRLRFNNYFAHHSGIQTV